MTKLARAFVLLALLSTPAIAFAQATAAREFSARCAAYYASTFKVPVELVDAIIEVESSWNPLAVSKKGAAGLMQLMPETALRFGVRDRFNVEENVRGGVAYLAWLIGLFHGDLRLAVAAYQVGEEEILARGLAYSSRRVFEYVSRVARIYGALRRERFRMVTADGAVPGA